MTILKRTYLTPCTGFLEELLLCRSIKLVYVCVFVSTAGFQMTFSNILAGGVTFKWREYWEGRNKCKCFQNELVPSFLSLPLLSWPSPPEQVTMRPAITRLQPEQSSNQSKYNQQQKADVWLQNIWRLGNRKVFSIIIIILFLIPSLNSTNELLATCIKPWSSLWKWNLPSPSPSFSTRSTAICFPRATESSFLETLLMC